MRSFIITLVLFGAVCTAIFFNCSYINRVSGYIEDCVSDDVFDSDPDGSIDALDSFWQKSIPWVGLSVGYKELDRMSDLILDLRTYFELENDSEVTRVRVLIKETASEISRLEKVSIENLF